MKNACLWVSRPIAPHPPAGSNSESAGVASRQTRFLREGLEDQLILEKAKGAEGMSREQIESRIVVPHHTIFLQIFPLYVLPAILIIGGYFFFSLLGFL